MEYSPNRRDALISVALTGLIPMQEAVAQTTARGGDWLAMVKVHHEVIAATMEKLVALSAREMPSEGMLKMLGSQLTAHSVAEENVIYPAMASNGMASEADKLYMDQAHAKVMNAQIEMALKLKEGKPWHETAKALQAAVLKHAKEDEEGNWYPKLQKKLTAQQNALLTTAYQREFNSVKI